MPTRSKELIEVGYFLSREGKSAPPKDLNTESWYQAYLSFYAKLHDGRTPIEFEHSLKNIRDQFDGYFPETKREGWKDPKNKKQPAKLSTLLKITFEKYKKYTSDGIWGEIKEYADTSFHYSKADIEDAYLPQRFDYYESQTVLTEGKKKTVISSYIERNPKLRHLAIQYHGLNCKACGFNFGEFYGKYGQGFIEIHHLIPLYLENNNTRETNYKTDLVPLCSNCHSIVHRKKGNVITLD